LSIATANIWSIPPSTPHHRRDPRRGRGWWEDARAQEYLGPDYDAEDYERVTDILDVWFDPGSTHAFVLEAAAGPIFCAPKAIAADLYLEGSDQHRGWFQSRCWKAAPRAAMPYKAVLTHGFTMDAKGMKCPNRWATRSIRSR
jgi:isoleucyl-tRNA synthetase